MAKWLVRESMRKSLECGHEGLYQITGAEKENDKLLFEVTVGDVTFPHT